MNISNVTDQITEDSIFKVGKVISVDGRLVRIKVDKEKNASHLIYKGELLKNVSVGGYVKIVKGFTKIIGKVEGEFTGEDKQFAKKEYGSQKDKISRTLNVSLLGFFRGDAFERGIKELPLIDNECFLLRSIEFNQVHNFVRTGDTALTLGNLSFEKGQAISVGINSLFASHFGIFGNTGSGKSYTLAKIYRELFERYKRSRKFRAKAKFFLIDFNGEYVAADGQSDGIIVDKKYKNSYKLSTVSKGGDKYPVSRKTLDDPDFWVIFLEATEKTQAPFLRRAIVNTYVAPKLKQEGPFKELIKRMVMSATTEGDRAMEKAVVINLLNDLSAYLGNNASINALVADYKLNLQYNSTTKQFYYQPPGQHAIYVSQPQFAANCVSAKIDALHLAIDGISDIDEICLQIVIQYYDDIIRGFSNKEHLAPLIKRMDKRIDDLRKVIEISDENPIENNRNLTIVSFKDVNLAIRKILPLLLCKRLYNDKKTNFDGKSFLNIVVDEAHNVLSENSERESEQWRDYRLETFEEIIKEGRKFGVFLTIASQRPSDISPTIISQLHNYFLHRLINTEDIKAVEKTISYLDKVSFEYLPILPTGTCIMAGLLANVPVVVEIGKIEPPKHEPKNKTLTLTDKWS